MRQFDEDALFYLRSRGIDSDEAMSLFVHGIGPAVTSKGS
ncbi:SufD family Fe-S cluster assembly protein [Thermococcus sp.]